MAETPAREKREGWWERAAGWLRALRPDAETRRRTRYFIFELLERNLPPADSSDAADELGRRY